jgi:hypothetical protein
VQSSGIGASIAVNRELAMKLRPEDYVEKLGGELREIGYYVYGGTNKPASDLTFRVYSQGFADNEPGDILAEKVLPIASAIEEEWNWVEIIPVQLTGGEYWVSVAFTEPAGQNYSMAIDGGPAKYGGDWVSNDGGAWYKLSKVQQDLQYNWAIQAKGGGEVQNLWGTLDKAYGMSFFVAPSEITVTAKSVTYPDLTTLTAKIVVLSNDPVNSRLELPLIMEVSNEEPSNDTGVTEVKVNGIVANKENNPSYDYRVVVGLFEGDDLKVDIVVVTEHSAATVSGHVGITPVQEGVNDFIFTVTAEDGVTIKDYKLRVLIEIEPKPALSELENNIKLFPNPVSDYLNIQSEVPVESISIYDLKGRVVKEVKQPGTGVDLSDLSVGYYMLKVTTKQGSAMQKFVKE